MNYESLGATLQQAREAQGLSIRQLAQLVEVSPSQILRWERDEYVPKVQALVALAMQLEMPAEELFAAAGISQTPGLIATIPAMLRADYDLPPEAIAEVEAHIAAVAKRYRAAKQRSSNAHNPEGRET